MRVFCLLCRTSASLRVPDVSLSLSFRLSLVPSLALPPPPHSPSLPFFRSSLIQSSPSLSPSRPLFHTSSPSLPPALPLPPSRSLLLLPSHPPYHSPSLPPSLVTGDPERDESEPPRGDHADGATRRAALAKADCGFEPHSFAMQRNGFRMRPILVLICLFLDTCHAGKNRGWLPEGQVVRGTRPQPRTGYGAAIIPDLFVIFGGNVQGSETPFSFLSLSCCLSRWLAHTLSHTHTCIVNPAHEIFEASVAIPP